MPAKRSPIAALLARATDGVLSVEINKLVMDPVDISTYMERFGVLKATQSYVKLYFKASGESFDIKMKVFDTNESSLFNEKIEMYRLDSASKVIYTQTKPISAVPQTATKLELVTYFSFDVPNRENWSIQVQLVKVLNNPLEFKTKLTAAKAALIGVSLDDMAPSAYDHVTTSLVQVSPEPTTHSGLLELIAELSIDDEQSDTIYQDEIYSLAKDIFRDAVTIAQFKRQSGFKRLCSNTIELSRPMFFKQVLPVIDTFYITDKMDGTRAMLVIEEVYRRSGHRRIYLGTDIKAVSDQVYIVNSFNKPTGSRTIETDRTVLDVEMMTDDKKNRQFFCFDVIALKSRKISNAPFKERFAKFDEVNTLMEKYELGSIKNFVKLTKEGYAGQIKDMYNEKRSYHIDGIIFTPEGVHYNTIDRSKLHKHERVFNTDYSSTISFKWKPVEQLTIDFYLMQHPTKKNSYVLCSGVDAKTFKLLRLQFFEGYQAPHSQRAHQYFPIQFEPYDGDFDNVWTPTKEDLGKHTSLDGMAGEFAFADSKGLFDQPKLLRLREDRVQDIAKGEYYGNALRYAELIWHSVKHPLTIDAMSDPADVGYFADDNNDWYHAQRSFNSFVKTHLLETYLFPKTNGPSRIMDIAAGKGQDLARAIDVGFDEIVLLDRDTDALYEMLERKYNLRVKRKGAQANVHIKHLDLEESADSNIKALKLPECTADAAMINFAIHYITHSASPGKVDPLPEFAKLCAHYLKPGARLLLTAFNGEDVFKALGTKDEWALTENGKVKYSIKREFSSTELTNQDQAIGVMLPFSAGRYYREYLVNYEYVQKVFEKEGLMLVRQESFGSLLRTYRKQNGKGFASMSDEDKAYVSMYGYMIFEKQ